ncbi:hypothetical protein A3H89_05265 [Candidatus Amesbacteria bacterium RIFCSPLOWO2_02_FULL_48_11]|uniref:Aminotransferase DegT n=4 Tax=Candidatus Amesiibacteriota TaxID=1752730 RepID=A0A1F4ZDW8_9BACT|nr:MAG: hypothetical protein UX78_C0003G0044 [Candidatus Amesbacteria bacterium GW2011_GWA2_47_11]KKU94448.1 MAG: hypothetical protein UY22_C0013G0013 [Candidatus Amesbacteria bacterium GW2011_GWC1_48_10]KKW01146.1 MAG: hypothetical protein UY33_C0001G0033 [Candidatus Amesbacteria bacterium GW2011_GWA1_48_9]OGC95431.1 MAG: hypothetical protein A3C34_03315 [Candidatus Amesbacteria bacterium RIFCSPHIGHO2_02_FULL_48_21]OGC98871.1 MAG: hypothetical protein A2702_02925 [Candidatus Amesbacteria bacte
MIPVNEPVISPQAKANVREALDTGWLSSAGPFVTRFEQDFARFLGVRHAVAVANGTAALHVALLALGIGPGDEVIVPAFTMASSWMAVLYTGAKPVFVDCELDTYNLDPALIAKAVTPRTKAIMPVHIYGHPVDMDPVLTTAKKLGLKVIEDAAEAHGAEYKGRLTGTMSDIACFSFYANKIVTTGEGGMLVTDNAALAHAARKYMDLYHSDAKRFIHEKLGFNFRLTNLQAAVGVGELANIKRYLAKKIRMAKKYANGLKNIPGITLPPRRPWAKNVYWMYAIRVDPAKFGLTKDELRIQLKDRGIDSRDFFYPPDSQPVLAELGVKLGSYPVCRLVSETGLYLPSGLAITDAQIAQVCQAIREVHKHARKIRA